MNIIYDEKYFNNGGDVGGYTNYREDSYWDEKADVLANKFIQKLSSLGVDLSNKKVLIVGCAYGFSIKYLVQLGVDAYGMDFSEYALTQVPLEIKDRVILGNATSDTDFQKAKVMAGMTKPNEKFDVIINEEMMCCLNDAEAVTFCTLSRKYSNLLIHYMEISPHISNWYNYHSLADWKVICDSKNKDKWYKRFSWNEE